MGISRTQLAEDYERLAQQLRQSDTSIFPRYVLAHTLFAIREFNEQRGLSEGDTDYFDPSWWKQHLAELEQEQQELDDEIESDNYSLGIWRHGDFVTCGCPKCADEVAHKDGE